MRPVRPKPVLRPATAADAAVALAWTPRDEDLRRWAGPDTRCPATPESFSQDINNADAWSFAPELPDGRVVGFGQVRHREGRFGHLARVIVSPAHRGHGFGRLLCTELMRQALRLQPLEAFSLYVFPDNLPALELYRSLGYRDQGMHTRFPCMLMTAPVAGFAQGTTPGKT